MSFNLGTIPAWATAAVAAVGAVRASCSCALTGGKTRVDRVIQLHQSLTGGEVGAARDRFTTFMWRVGAPDDPTTRSPRRPTLDSLDFATRSPSTSNEEHGSLARYPDDLTDSDCIDPLPGPLQGALVLERIDAARSHNTLDKDLLLTLIGFHAAWWDRLLSRIGDGDSQHRRALADLAAYCLENRPDLEESVERGHVRGASD